MGGLESCETSCKRPILFAPKKACLGRSELLLCVSCDEHEGSGKGIGDKGFTKGSNRLQAENVKQTSADCRSKCLMVHGTWLWTRTLLSYTHMGHTCQCLAAPNWNPSAPIRLANAPKQLSHFWVLPRHVSGLQTQAA